jgi:hypothetical protein
MKPCGFHGHAPPKPVNVLNRIDSSKMLAGINLLGDVFSLPSIKTYIEKSQCVDDANRKYNSHSDPVS